MTNHDLRMGESSPVASSTRAAERSTLVRVGVVAAVACGVLTTVHEVWDASIPGIQQGAGWSLLHTCWLAAMFLAFLGISVGAAPRTGQVRPDLHWDCPGGDGRDDGGGCPRDGHVGG